jgi:hypothetical protein
VIDPLIHRAQRVESVGAFTATAVIHAGQHEQAVFVLKRAHASQLGRHGLVIVDAVRRRDPGICPAVVLQQFSATIEEGCQIWIDRIHCPPVDLVREGRVSIEIIGLVIPVGILEHHELEDAGGKRHGLGRHCSDAGRPSQLASKGHSGIDILLGARIDRATIDLSDRVDLRGSQAIRTVFTLAFDNSRIELASSGILHDAVLDAVSDIARREHGVVKNRQLGRWDETTWLLPHRLRNPDRPTRQACHVVGGRSRNDAIVVGRKALGLH